MVAERATHRVPNQSGALDIQCIEDLPNVIDECVDRVFPLVQRLVRQPVTLEIDADRAEAGIGNRRQIVAEYVRGTSPAMQEDYRRRVRSASLHCAYVEA